VSVRERHLTSRVAAESGEIMMQKRARAVDFASAPSHAVDEPELGVRGRVAHLRGAIEELERGVVVGEPAVDAVAELMSPPELRQRRPVR
jgi:hypothetical protein